ncbi:MAG TPA: TolC family protein [Bryobacteraceae bacterium]|nr:TolC family protein [Bryobacteraceae bacterium]
MKTLQSHLAILCAFLIAAPLLPAGETQTENGITIQAPTGGGPLGGIIHPYQGHEVAPVNLTNSSRLDALIRAGKIYLSLQDTIALALENNLDIAVQRYGPLIAEQDLKRAQSGGAIRGVQQSVQQGPSGGGQGVSSGQLGNPSANSGSSSGSTAGVNGIITQLGPTTPNLDPVLQAFTGWFHQTSPQTSTFLTGTTSVVSKSQIYDFSLSQGFLTGGQAVLSYNDRVLNQNSPLNSVNPSTALSLDLTMTQHLLQGFGIAVNNRNIRVAQNEVKLSDVVFREQLINTVSSIITLYWNLVSFNENVDFAKQNLALAQKTYDDNQKQVQIGTLAPIEIVRAEAEVAARQQDLTIAETNVLQQETTLKNALSRNGIASPEVMEARIVPTDRIRVPENETVQPMPELVQLALRDRPEISQSKFNVENSRISLIGQKSGLLPTLDAVAELTNHGQSGDPNLKAIAAGIAPPPDPYFVGGYGTAAGQVFRRNFPDYLGGLQLNMILRNRSAQADYVYNSLQIRQQELSQQKQLNQVRVDVQNAVIGLQQARARYQAAVKQRILEEQTLDAEQKKLALGASTIFLVIQDQRDLAQAQSNQVNAQSQYQQARVNLDVSTGQLLTAYNISIDEAHTGRVSRPPSPLPPLEQKTPDQK